MRKLLTALGLAGSLALSGCDSSNPRKLNMGEMKQTIKILDQFGTLIADPKVGRPGGNSGNIIQFDGTDFYLRLSNGRERFLFTTPLFVYDIQVGNLNSDSLPDFVITGNTIRSDGTNSIKEETLSQQYFGYFSKDNRLLYSTYRH